MPLSPAVILESRIIAEALVEDDAFHMDEK